MEQWRRVFAGMAAALMAGSHSLAMAAGAEFSGTTENVHQLSERIMYIVVPAIIIVFFIGGAVAAGMGIFAMMNKESNPQAAQGAWKKLAGGGALMAFSVVIGVLRATIGG